MAVTTDLPKAGVDYPKDWGQFLDWFQSEDACRDFVERLRWPDGFQCPKCSKFGDPSRSTRGRIMCRICKFQASVTSGTLFDKTRTELRIWFAAMWYVTNQKQGVSALGLQRVLGLGSYETAWTMLHRLRRAMVRPGRDLLHGEVEVDETYVALGERKKAQPADTKAKKTTKVLVAVAVEKQSKGFGRIRLRRIEHGNRQTLQSFIQDAIEPGTLVHSDGSWAYQKLEDIGYLHKRTVHLGSDVPAHETMPAVHRVAALLQRWLMGTHHGAVQPGQLDYYLDEFVFRFNRRTSSSRGLLFYRLLQQSTVMGPVTYDGVVAGC